MLLWSRVDKHGLLKVRKLMQDIRVLASFSLAPFEVSASKID